MQFDELMTNLGETYTILCKSGPWPINSHANRCLHKACITVSNLRLRNDLYCVGWG